MLLNIGVHGKFMDLIMACVCLVTFQAIINGEVTVGFTMPSDIRQGDPLSPYLFILDMEKLSHLITQSVEYYQWKSVPISQEGPSVSHLFIYL